MAGRAVVETKATSGDFPRAYGLPAPAQTRKLASRQAQERWLISQREQSRSRLRHATSGNVKLDIAGTRPRTLTMTSPDLKMATDRGRTPIIRLIRMTR